MAKRGTVFFGNKITVRRYLNMFENLVEILKANPRKIVYTEGADAVIVAGPAHEGQPRLPGAVFIVAQQGLADAQVLGRLTLADIPFPPEGRQGFWKGSVHGFPSCLYIIISQILQSVYYTEENPLCK